MPLEKYVIQQIATNSITPPALYNMQVDDTKAKELAEALKTNHNITNLQLYTNQIRDAGTQALAEALKTNHNITNLGLHYNQIGDAGVQALAEALKDNKSITQLYLYNNQIGDTGVQALAEALKVNYTITDLHLYNNQIGDAGAQAMAEALKVNKAITIFHISYNPIGPVGVRYLADALKINKSIVTFDTGFNNIGDIVKKEIETALQINKDFPAEAKKEAERLEKEAKIREQEEAEATKEAARLKAIEEARQQEAERLEQEARLKEQEEDKAAKEAAKLKAIEEAKVKEYIPDIPVVKLFEVAGGDNQFDNDDQATIKEVSELIREGNDRLQEHGKKGILLLGNTGAGKSTLAHLFSGKKLQAIFDNETAELVIEAMYPLENIVIGHKSASETKIPNKCLAKDLIIWDCPGFNDTDPVQEIANSFYIKRLFETTKQLKFVLVVPESVLNIAIERGNIFLAALSNFIKSFKDIESIKGSISLVVTHVPPNKNIQHIKTSIDKILKDNQGATDEHKDLINKLKDDGLIHLFYKPTEEGELTVPDLLAEIEKSPEYSDAKGDMVNIAISQKAKDCSSHLLNTASNNFNQLLEVIVKAISNATQCSNVNPLNAFSENYVIVKDWVPSSIRYNELKQHSEGEYFLKLELLSRLQKVLNYNQIVSISDAIMVLQIAVDIFAEYAESDNSQLKNQIQDYGYCLQQQYEYIKFFASVCGDKLPDHAKIVELITTCHTKVTENLEYQVSSLKIDENQSDSDYYTKAIEYLENYKDSPACKNLKAIAYSCLASIADNEREALDYYVKAIEANSHLPTIYGKLGQLFFNKGEYAKAIDCYKVVNNALEIKECFKAWLEQDKRNPDIMLEYAEYSKSVGLFERAKKYYEYACGVNQDDNFKTAAYKKIANIMVNAAVQGQNFATKAEDYDFYNYDLVDRTFIDSLLVGEVDGSRCDLYC